MVECIAIIGQTAYLESLKRILSLPEYRSLLKTIGNTPASAQLEKEIRKLGEAELKDDEIMSALVSFPESRLSEEFSRLLLARLHELGIGKGYSRILAERVAWNTHRYMSKAIIDAGKQIEPLAEIYRTNRDKELGRYGSLDRYLKEQIAPGPHGHVFTEGFTYKDIYVRLKAFQVNPDTMFATTDSPDYLDKFILNILRNSSDPNRFDRKIDKFIRFEKVIFIQGGPGRGKSVFCRMFADWVYRFLHPSWTPILIRLRDIETFHPSLESTLKSCVNYDFAQADPGWLTDRHTRYLFILDGFDELRMEGRSSGGLEEFLKQVGGFQRDCSNSSEMQHRVLITGRPLALHGIERFLPSNLERLEILPMDEGLQGKWLKNWGTLFGDDKASAFQKFLEHEWCPQQVCELAREPLLLYLLAAMHRDDVLSANDFEKTSSTKSKILIYEKSLDWVLTKQRDEWLQRELTGIDVEDLKHILSATGLCVVQSGGEYTKVSMLEDRLKDHEHAFELIRQAKKRQNEEILKNALVSFYLKPTKDEKIGAVEFAHKSFGEFLCARYLQNIFEDWTQKNPRYKSYLIQNDKMFWQIYDLLGFGVLTSEVISFLMGLVSKSETFRPVELFGRLEAFYTLWTQSEFMDSLSENFPQRKLHEMREQGIYLGAREIDIYAGLNILILCLEIQRYMKSKEGLRDMATFHPCSVDGHIYPDQMSRIIGYTNSMNPDTFASSVGIFFSESNLSNVNLCGMDLTHTNFSHADLRRTRFAGACLIKANFTGCDLSEADLSKADLSHANLSHANLSHARLCRAGLKHANLCEANLSNSDLSFTDLAVANLTKSKLCCVNLAHAYLDNAILHNADLKDAQLTYASAMRANLHGANLSRADLTHANLAHADLKEACLRRAELSDANLIGASFQNADLNYARLMYANLFGADLSNADLKNADMSHADLCGAILNETDFDGSNLENTLWHLEYTNWKAAKNLKNAVLSPNLREILMS